MRTAIRQEACFASACEFICPLGSEYFKDLAVNFHWASHLLASFYDIN
jgi:hypothetical protein